MLNIFMLCRDDPAAAAQSLAALVPGVVLGHVGRVVLQAPQDSEALRHLADEAGCDLVTGADSEELFLAERRRRPGWWIVMQSGQIPAEGWSDEAMRHAALRMTPAAILPARGFQKIVIARAALLLGLASTRHHMLLLPQSHMMKGKAGQLGCRAKATPLRAVFES